MDAGKKRMGIKIVLALLLAAALAAGCNGGYRSTGEELAVHFIDVGQGDSILIEGPDFAVLIDGGYKENGPDVADYLRARGITRLDLVVATHPHGDHIGGLIQVLLEFEVDEVLDPGVAYASGTYEEFLDVIDSREIAFTEARAGMRRDLGAGISLHVLHPADPQEGGDPNHLSVVTRLTYGNAAFLFAGDAEAADEEEMLERGHNLRADVLKVGHHGSYTSTSRDFLRAVDPLCAVIMLGADNGYGYPHQEVLDLLNDRDIPIFRTDVHGTIVFTTDGENIDVSTERN